MIIVHKLPRPSSMDDSTNVGAIPADAKCVAGYVDGNFANFSALVKRFQGKADIVSIGIFANSIADFVDVEPGNPVTSPGLVRMSFEHRKTHGVFRPGFYGDRTRMAQTIIPGLAGIPRNEYRLWLADWTDKPHVPAGFDGCQFESLRSPNIDVSILEPSFFPPNSISKPKRKIHLPYPAKRVLRKIHPKVKAAIPGGGSGVGIATLLQHNGVHLTSAESALIGAVLAILAAALKGGGTP